MDLRRLEHLLALAEERHFGRAADRVHLSQPAVRCRATAVQDHGETEVAGELLGVLAWGKGFQRLDHRGVALRVLENEDRVVAVFVIGLVEA